MQYLTLSYFLLLSQTDQLELQLLLSIYIADLATGTTGNNYFTKIQGPGRWELIFLAGAFISGIIISLIRKEFKLKIIHSNWKKYKGNSVSKKSYLVIYWRFHPNFWSKDGWGMYQRTYPFGRDATVS